MDSENHSLYLKLGGGISPEVIGEIYNINIIDQDIGEGSNFRRTDIGLNSVDLCDVIMDFIKDGILSERPHVGSDEGRAYIEVFGSYEFFKQSNYFDRPSGFILAEGGYARRVTEIVHSRIPIMDVTRMFEECD